MPELTTVYCLPVGTNDSDLLVWDTSSNKWLARSLTTDDVSDRSDFPQSTLTEVLDSIYDTLQSLTGAEASLSTNVTLDHEALQDGETGELTIVLTNTSASDALDIDVVSSWAPTGKVTTVSVTQGNNGQITATGAQWPDTTIPANDSVTLAFSYIVNSVASEEVITNTTTFTGLSPSLTNLTLLPSAGGHFLTIEKKIFNSALVEDENFAADQPVTYQFIIRNFGDAQADNITIRDSIDTTKFDTTTFTNTSGAALVNDGSWYVEWDENDNIDVPAFSGGSPGIATVNYTITLEGTDVFTSGTTVIGNTVQVTEVNGVAHGSPLPQAIRSINVTPTEPSGITVDYKITHLNDSTYNDTWVNPGTIGPTIQTGDKLTFRCRVSNSETIDGIVNVAVAWTEELGIPTNFQGPTSAAYDSVNKTLTWTAGEVKAGLFADFIFDQFVIAEAIPFNIASTATVTDTSVTPEVQTVVVKDFGASRFFDTPLLDISTFVSAVGPSPTELIGYLDQDIYVGDFVKVGIHVFDAQDPSQAAFSVQFTESFSFNSDDYVMNSLTATDGSLVHDADNLEVEGDGITIPEGGGRFFFYTMQVLSAKTYNSTATIDYYESGDGVAAVGTPTDTLALVVNAPEAAPASAKWIWDGSN